MWSQKDFPPSLNHRERPDPEDQTPPSYSYFRGNTRLYQPPKGLPVFR